MYLRFYLESSSSGYCYLFTAASTIRYIAQTACYELSFYFHIHMAQSKIMFVSKYISSVRRSTFLMDTLMQLNRI